VNIDEKGRIVIPADVRKVIGRRALSVEMADKNTIILRASEEPSILIKRIQEIKLDGDKTRQSMDFSDVKDLYGGKRVENT